MIQIYHKENGLIHYDSIKSLTQKNFTDDYAVKVVTAKWIDGVYCLIFDGECLKEIERFYGKEGVIIGKLATDLGTCIMYDTNAKELLASYLYYNKLIKERCDAELQKEAEEREIKEKNPTKHYVDFPVGTMAVIISKYYRWTLSGIKKDFPEYDSSFLPPDYEVDEYSPTNGESRLYEVINIQRWAVTSSNYVDFYTLKYGKYYYFLARQGVKLFVPYD